MTRRNVLPTQRELDRQAISRKLHQEYIVKTFGAEYVAQKQQELCLACADRVKKQPLDDPCFGHLIPVTTKGEDCPYFRRWRCE